MVYKSQYFWSFSRKNDFRPFLSIFQRAITHSKIVRITWFFFSKCSEDSNEVFLFFEFYHFVLIIGRKCRKTDFFGGHLGFLAAILKFFFGTISGFDNNIKSYPCAKFGAFNPNWTIEPILSTSDTDYNNYFSKNWFVFLLKSMRCHFITCQLIWVNAPKWGQKKHK